MDATVNRQWSEELKLAAGEVRSRSRALRAASAVLRGGQISFRDQMAVWQETHRTLREMEETARELAVEREEGEREVAEQTAWVRAQVESMLDAGWARGELAEIGIADEVLALVGMLDDPRLRGGPDARAGARGNSPPGPRR
ncbi:MAG: hypothetical protein ABW277_15550 [Longimicrobiaceae bacterium]